jgi:hypothetical protein
MCLSSTSPCRSVENWRYSFNAFTSVLYGDEWLHLWPGHFTHFLFIETKQPPFLADGLFTGWASSHEATDGKKVSSHCSYSNPMITAFGKNVVTCSVSLLLALTVVLMCCEYDRQNDQYVILNEAPCCSGTDTYLTGIFIPSGRNRNVIQEK